MNTITCGFGDINCKTHFTLFRLLAMSSQITLGFSGDFEIPQKMFTFKEIIIDRKSKYSVVGCYVDSKERVGECVAYLRKDTFFRKADHNSYAYRIKQENGSILEGKNDDGETGAGMCILRELQRENAVNIVLVVTRYFGGIKLETDRYKNVIDACKIFFENIKK